MTTMPPGHEFLSKLETAEAEIRAQNEKMASLQKNLPEENRDEISSQIDMAIGSGALILKGKCKQFRGLCQKNIDEASNANTTANEFPTTEADLEGFWDMLSLPIQKVMEGFAAIERLKENGWREPVVVVDGNKAQKLNQPKKKPLASKNDAPSENSNRQKEEARRRLMQFKKAAKDKLQNQNAPDSPLIVE